MGKWVKQLLGLALLCCVSVAFASYYVDFASNGGYSGIANHSDDQASGMFESEYPTDDIWRVLQREFTLSHDATRPEVKAQIAWFLKNKKFIYNAASNAKPYMYYILQQVRKRHLPTEIVLLPMIESAYNPFAYSHAGASGLWQMMPGTASGFGLKQDWWYDGRRDVIASTDAALNYLSYLQNFFSGNSLLAIAAYDGGEGTVLRSIRRNIAKGETTDFWSLSLPRETQAYIPKLLALAEIISHPTRYPVELPKIENKPYLSTVDVGFQMDLKMAAELSHLTLEELVKLNSGYNRWATSPEGPYQLVVPIEKVATFKANLANLPESKRVTWKRYNVTSGDSLGYIAKKFGTSVSLLKQVNKLDSDNIKIGEVLFIPLSTGQLPSQIIDSARKYVNLEQTQTVGPQKIVYTVVPNDTLWKISHKFKVRESAIQFWNGMKKSDVLQPGQQIIMWVKSKSHHESAARVTQQSYTVRSGDTLGKIARKFNTTVELVRSVNHLSGNLIQPGQELSVYDNLLLRITESQMQIYTVKSGDNLNALAKVFDTNANTIKSLNGMSSTMLRVGQKIIVVPHALPTVNNLDLRSHEPQQNMYYIVQPNDNLLSIAAKFNLSVNKVKEWNPGLDGSDYLQPYTLLNIFV